MESSLKRTNHLLHIVLTFFTAGLWLFVYIPLLIVRASKPDTTFTNQSSPTSCVEPTIRNNENQADNESDWETQYMSETWEYKVISNLKLMGNVNSATEKELNKLGKEGWEAFAMHILGSGAQIIILKRRLS